MIGTNEIILRLLMGALMGGTIGFERQIHGRPAGFRTHLIVCVATVLLMMTSEYYHHISLMDPAYVRVDPGRIAAGAITGIGFLGAGVILKTGPTIQGLTTAASIWMVSAIGLSLGAGLYLPATVSFLLTAFALIVLRTVEKKLTTVTFRAVTLTAEEAAEEGDFKKVLAGHGAKVHNIDYEKDVATGEINYRLTVSLMDSASLKEILDGLSALKGVKKITIKS
jgi:putative Mg2+ transporter-C (MgtC) family protein